MIYALLQIAIALAQPPTADSVPASRPSASPSSATNLSSTAANPATLDRSLDDQVTLITGNNTPDARRIGARALLAIGSTESVRRLAVLLQRDSDTAAHVAICSELAVSETALPTELIAPVLSLLGSPRRDVVDTAIRAVARFNDVDVIPQLTQLATTGTLPGGATLSAIAALGRIGASPQAVDALFLICSRWTDTPSAATSSSAPSPPRPTADAEFHAAVLAALERATGMSFIDVGEAGMWWKVNRDRDPVGYLQDRDARRERWVHSLESRVDELIRRLIESQRSDYLTRSDADKTTALLAMLSDAEPAVRGLGLELTNSLITDRRAVPAPVVLRVRGLLSDSAPEVRRAAALVLADVRDPADVTLLRDGLARETVPRVRAALLKSLGRLADATVLSLLLPALDDRSREVRIEAVAAVGALSERLTSASPEAVEAVGALLDHLDSLTASDAQAIEACLEALGRFSDRRCANAFLRYLSPDWPPSTRQTAIRGGSMLPGGIMAEAIAGLLTDQHVAVRVAAAGAMGACGRTDAHLSALAARLVQATEPEVTVRLKAWESVARILSSRPRLDQCQWATRLPPPADAASAAGRVEWLTRLCRESADDAALVTWRARVNECLADALLLTGQADAAILALQRIALPDPGGSSTSGVQPDTRILRKAVSIALKHQRAETLADLLLHTCATATASAPSSQATSPATSQPADWLLPDERAAIIRLLSAAVSDGIAATQPAASQDRLAECLRWLVPEWPGIPAGADTAARQSAIQDLLNRI